MRSRRIAKCNWLGRATPVIVESAHCESSCLVPPDIKYRRAGTPMRRVKRWLSPLLSYSTSPASFSLLCLSHLHPPPSILTKPCVCGKTAPTPIHQLHLISLYLASSAFNISLLFIRQCICGWSNTSRNTVSRTHVILLPTVTCFTTSQWTFFGQFSAVHNWFGLYGFLVEGGIKYFRVFWGLRMLQRGKDLYTLK